MVFKKVTKIIRPTDYKKGTSWTGAKTGLWVIRSPVGKWLHRVRGTALGGKVYKALLSRDHAPEMDSCNACLQLRSSPYARSLSPPIMSPP